MKRYRCANLGEFKALFRAHTKKREAELNVARDRAVEQTMARLKELAPHASGGLADSLHVLFTPRTARIISDAPHFLAVDVGSRPHMPPIEPLIAWCQLRGFADPKGAAWAIATKIKREGTAPTHFTRAAFDALLDVLKREVAEALERMP